MTAMSIRQIQALDYRIFEESAKDLLRNHADWVATFGDMVLVALYGKFQNEVWLCSMPHNEVSLMKAKMIKRIV